MHILLNQQKGYDGQQVEEVIGISGKPFEYRFDLQADSGKKHSGDKGSEVWVCKKLDKVFGDQQGESARTVEVIRQPTGIEQKEAAFFEGVEVVREKYLEQTK